MNRALAILLLSACDAPRGPEASPPSQIPSRDIHGRWADHLRTGEGLADVVAAYEEITAERAASWSREERLVFRIHASLAGAKIVEIADDDPRLAFALEGPARVYFPETLDAQLEDAVDALLRDPAHVRIAGDRLWMSAALRRIASEDFVTARLGIQKKVQNKFDNSGNAGHTTSAAVLHHHGRATLPVVRVV